MKITEQFTPIPVPSNVALAACPVCGGPAELYEDTLKSGSVRKVVCCSTGEASAQLAGGCVLFLPPEEFYYPTIREAARHWNSYAEAAGRMRVPTTAADMRVAVISRLIQLGKMQSSPGFGGPEADLVAKFSTMSVTDLLTCFELNLLTAHKAGFITVNT